MNDNATVDVQIEEHPLEGFTVAITASRRRDELKKAFEKRGAKVIVGSSIEIVPLDRDEELRAVTQQCISTPLDYVVATTGIGFRGWMEAADAWGLGEALRKAISRASLLARGPKARGSIRASNLTESWTPSSESMSEVLDYLLERDLTNLTVVVQQHGEPLPDVVDSLKAAGAFVINVPVYRWVLPDDISDVKRLVEATISGQVDCVTFTSAPAVLGLLKVANIQGYEEALLESFRTDVAAMCVGPVCSAPLERRGVPVLLPQRSRLGSLIHLVAEELPRRSSRTYLASGHRLEIRGHSVLVDGKSVYIPPAPMAILKSLAKEPGKVVTRAELSEQLPGEEIGPHALEMTLTRLRSLLGDPKIIQTVVKRGYRLAFSPESAESDLVGGCFDPPDTSEQNLSTQLGASVTRAPAMSQIPDQGAS